MATRRSAAIASIRAQVGRNGDEGWRHQAAGAIRRVGQQLADFGRIVRPHRDQDGFHIRIGQFIHNVGGVIRRHRSEHAGSLDMGEVAQDDGSLTGRQVRQHFWQHCVRQGLHQDDNLSGIEAGNNVRPGGGADALAQRDYARSLARVQQGAHLREQRLSLHDHSSPGQGPGALAQRVVRVWMSQAGRIMLVRAA